MTISLDDYLSRVEADGQWHRFTQRFLDSSGKDVKHIYDRLTDKFRTSQTPVIIDVVSTPGEYDIRCRIDLLRQGWSYKT